MNSVIYGALIIVSGLLLTACASTLTPQQVAEGYWHATIAQNSDQLRQFISEADSGELNPPSPTWQNADVTFGEAIINDNVARVDTAVILSTNDNVVALKFTTDLKKETNGWKVDSKKTADNIQTEQNDRLRAQENNLANSLLTLSKKMAREFDNASDELKKRAPEIKEDLNTLGNTIEKEIIQAWKQYGPVIQDNLNGLANAINKAIEETKKNKQAESIPDPSINSI